MQKIVWGIIALVLFIPNKQNVVYAQNTPKAVTEVPIYTDCQNYNNKLSAIASSIDFIPIDENPLLNDFHIINIEICDEYFFLSGMDFIYQYKKDGTFVKTIGRRGNGPKEYINIIGPLGLDCSRKLIYAHDVNRNRVVIYDYNGTFKGTFPLSGSKSAQLISSEIMALRQSISDRELSNVQKIDFLDTEGKKIRSISSHVYPIDKDKKDNLGPDMSPMWSNGANTYYLEYGTDTIFRISGTSLIAERILSGKLKSNVEEHYSNSKGKKLNIVMPILRFNSGVFESNRFMIFRLSNDYETFFMVYDKNTGRLQRTFYENAPRTFRGPKKKEGPKKHDCFIDDMISGLSFNPEYQSNGKAIALISASDICEKRKDILDFIDKHPSEKSKKLRGVIQNMTEEDNSLMMVVGFK
ncbi:6-bladed beta-propeller [Bacteroides sp. OttesenSCG-928-J23]|nr:6-bladed beta-propeller [Bacteroides sp. OttesenSCG-928-J23]MDL2299659.1 6-bladed beta-propeller [Bacteroides sp. OttesenSCG-928-E20]